ncbi:hypothetical protein KY284_007772 [Solanum tuberosum]|nr:hypothetical protein KY284_007772 [Solanum tuberosum]
MVASYPILLVIDLQLTHFNGVVELLVNKLGSQQSQQLLTDAVYMFSTGSNDYAFPYLTNPKKFPFPKEQFSEMVLGNFTAILQVFNVSIEACCGTGAFKGINSCGGKRQVKEYELCKNVTDFVFFDASHPTEAANQ